ncbi:FHA domain-containing protein [Pedobacter sp. PAMC26386]|nr:FHA domain-containing protein [Pedobacter sp. PAMC26386]
MFDFFKKNKTDNPLDAKSLREVVLQFIKEELQKLDGGEGKHLKALQVFVNAGAEELFLYETALYSADPEKFQEEVQRIADNFALDLPADWKLEVRYVAELPVGIIQHKDIKLGLILKSAALPISNQTRSTARLKVITGKAEQEEYILKPGTSRINIGREGSVQASDGSYRVNTIAFLAEMQDSNKYISRQHAHLEWDKEAGCFKLYADEGGVPPGNKTKIRAAHDENTHKLNSTQIGYALKEGDQIILADVAVLEFTMD